MDVQNISGTDIISSQLNINSRITNENTNIERKEVPEPEIYTENTKGTIIDTRA